MKRRIKTIINGRKNICGKNIRKIRKSLVPSVSQNDLASRLQLLGLNVHKNMVQMVESGKQCVTDVELSFFARALNVKITQLIEEIDVFDVISELKVAEE